MDMKNCSINNDSVLDFLRELDETSDKASIPAVVMLVTFAVVGFVGNILVLVVYSKKMRLNPTKVLIMTIASFDLVANVAAIPTAITTMFDTWNFSRPVLCKITVFLGSFTALGGAISLLIVAVIRYRKVCRPYGWQLTVRQAVVASLGSFLLAFLFSIPYIIIYGVRTRQTPCPNVFGFDCFADDDYFNTIWPLLNNILFMFLFVTLSIPMIVLYIFIGVTAWRHSRYHEASAETTTKYNKSKPTSKQTSAVTIKIISPAGTPKNEPMAPTTHPSGCMDNLFCCSGHQTFDRSTEDTPSSSTMRSHCTTDTDMNNTSFESIRLQPIVDGNTNIQSVFPSSLDTSLTHYSHGVHSAHTNQYLHPESNFPETKTQRKLSRTFDEMRHANENLLPDNISHEGDIELHPKDDTPKKEPNLHISPGSRQDYSSPSENTKKEKRRVRLGRITAMLIIISAIYVFGFFPFLILTVYKSKNPEKYANFNLVQQVFFNIFYRLYFLNSAANSIVYSWCDLNFRRKCIQLLTCQSTRHK